MCLARSVPPALLTGLGFSLLLLVLLLFRLLRAGVFHVALLLADEAPAFSVQLLYVGAPEVRLSPASSAAVVTCSTQLLIGLAFLAALLPLRTCSVR